MKLPKKLKYDAVQEAVFEARFELNGELATEVIFGRLADLPHWREYVQRRLPAADIPLVLRMSDNNLKFQPSLELASKDAAKIIRIGQNSISFSERAPYSGWDAFRNQIQATVSALWDVAKTPEVSRLGLRYINALTSDRHGISGVEDLQTTITVAGAPIKDRVNLNYRTTEGRHICATRIATLDYVTGGVPPNSSLVVDIDVYTPDGYSATDPEVIIRWAAEAHDIEKTAFFGLWPKSKLDPLRID